MNTRMNALLHRIGYWATPVMDLLPMPLTPQRERRFHVFGLGAPRSGTVSLSELFHGFRNAHEPESRFFTRHVLEYRQQHIDRDTFARYLRQRDRRMQLEMDSSYINAEIAEVLVDVFPTAKFILSMRDCLAWTDSMLNFLQNKPEFLTGRKGSVNQHLQMRLGRPPYSYQPGEGVLAERKLPPLEHFLHHWRHHNEHVLASVPAERLLVLRTEDIGKRAADVERFLQLPPHTLAAGVHSNPASARHSLLDRVEPALLADLVERHCGPLMRRYFPQRKLETA